jgi:hypothetical protein
MKLLVELYEKFIGPQKIDKEAIAKVYHNDYLKHKKKKAKKTK